jgi:subtilase family serine protease
MKKLLFSFLKPNEAKKSIMNRRKKIQVSRLYKKIKQSKVASNSLILAKSKLTLLTDKIYNSSTSSHFKTYTTKTKNSYELFLPRVKFKPGYQRL